MVLGHPLPLTPSILLSTLFLMYHIDSLLHFPLFHFRRDLSEVYPVSRLKVDKPKPGGNKDDSDFNLKHDKDNTLTVSQSRLSQGSTQLAGRAVV